MKITVREALQLPALQRAVLLAGAAGLDRNITSVNIMEVPEIRRFVKQDEFLVTTTYPIKDDPAAQAALISDLAQQGLAALAIKPVFYQNEVPEVMIRQAEELAFPLIRLPDDASFNEIINPILAEILNRQATILRRNEEVHTSLANIVLNGGSLGEIARMLAGWLQTPVSIHSPALRLLAHWGDWGRELAADSARLKAWFGGQAGQVRVRDGERELAVMVHPVTVAREDYAYLCVWREHGGAGRYEPNVVEQAGLVVALEVAKLRAVAEVEQRFRASFIDDLVQGRVSARADALARGELYGWDLSGTFVPLLLEIDDFRRLSLSRQGARDMPRLLRRLRDAAAAAAAAHAAGSIAVDMGSRILLLLRLARPASRALVRKGARELAARVQTEVTAGIEVTVSAGIGRPFDDILNLRTGFGQASRAMEVGWVMAGPGAVTHFDDLGVYRILADYKDLRELELFCQDLLAGLLDSDRRAGTDLVRTLEVVLQTGGNLRQAARALYIHYNTLRYRVARIEEITGVDLGSAEGRLNLQVAVKILRMHKGT